jgi:hypothetical protein
MPMAQYPKRSRMMVFRAMDIGTRSGTLFAYKIIAFEV